MTTDQHVEIADLVPEWQRDLVYIDYRDELSPQQVDTIIADGWDETVDELISEAQWEAAWEIAGDLLERNPGLTQEQHELADEIRELDTSNPYRDLLGNTGLVLFRFSPCEDGMAFLDSELDDPAAACEALGLGPEFVDVVRSILPEVAGYRAEGGGWFGASIVFRANAADMIEWGTHVTVSDPFVWLTNPWSGNGYGEVAKGLSIKLRKADVHVDRFAWGYGADDVFGGLILDDSDITITTEEE